MRPLPIILEDLKTVDRFLNGDMNYEHAWVNCPTKPEVSPADLLRGIIKELEGPRDMEWCECAIPRKVTEHTCVCGKEIKPDGQS